MQETLVPLKIPPGLYRVGTELDAAGRWYDGNLVRWVEGCPQPVGGWRVTQDTAGGNVPAVDGVPRAVRPWRTSTGLVNIGIGTNEKLYVLQNGDLNDVTPADLVAGNADSVLVGGTYGTGVYGAGPYGSGSGALVLDEADTWQLDTFGDYMVAVLSSDGRLLIWANDTGTAADGASGAPIDNLGVVVTPERFIAVLGAGGNVRKVQWPDQETTDVWTPTATNQAGDFELQTAGRIRCGARTKAQTLIWTDADLWTMTYIGGELVYSFEQAGNQCGIISPNAKVVVGTQAFWMGRDAFYKFDGFVQEVPCEVRDFVFEDLNQQAIAKIWAMSVAAFSEVTWFFPSGGATEIDKYVTYNYRDNHWTFGHLTRTAGHDANAYPSPVMCDDDGVIYDHEVAEDRSGSPGTYLLSGPITLDPDHIMRIQRIVPDGSNLTDTTMVITSRMFPLGEETVHGAYSLANPIDTRITGRHFRFELIGASSVSWRLGVPQLGVRQLGRR